MVFGRLQQQFKGKLLHCYWKIYSEQSSIYKSDSYLDNGLLRWPTWDSLPQESKHPLILYKDVHIQHFLWSWSTFTNSLLMMVEGMHHPHEEKVELQQPNQLLAVTLLPMFRMEKPQKGQGTGNGWFAKWSYKIPHSLKSTGGLQGHKRIICAFVDKKDIIVTPVTMC